MNKMMRRRARPFYILNPPPEEPLPRETKYVSFVKIPNARTGNIIFQYLFAISISIRFGHKYIAIEDFPIPMNRTIKVTEDSIPTDDDEVAKTSNIICEGFFQRSEHFVPMRDQLLAYLRDTEDTWVGFTGKRESIRNFLTGAHSVPDLSPHDIVMSVRLDDFIQIPGKTSDILPVAFYRNILEKWFSEKGREKGRLIIVCDKLRHHWEHKYMEFFQKWSPVLIQNTLEHDCALMYDCPALIHSNSTLCWVVSFLSEKKTHRYIPMTGFYGGQNLREIENGDQVFHVNPMTRDAVFALKVMCEHRDIEGLPYSIPNELIVGSEPVDKKYVVSPLVPGDSTDYSFGLGQESEYYDMYKSSRFALTQKKGGWDCLRHYEIMANGAIPIFDSIKQCPPDTMVTFPKSLLVDAARDLLPWYGTEEQQVLYEKHRSEILNHAREHCSDLAVAGKFLKSMSCGSEPKILMLTGHSGVNYTRELTWIGIKRLVGGIAVEWPPIDYLYDSFNPNEPLYGNGFTYSRRLPDSLNIRLTEEEVVKSIVEKRWDLIIYGKVGADEDTEGSLPNLPLWEHVFKRYSRDEIAFWYGGDGMQDMTYHNRYSAHLAQHCQYAHCFVRELVQWDGRHK